MIIRKHRLDKGWSQETLAEVAGLSVRTIQRIERGGSASLDSMGALAAAFDVSISDLSMEADMYSQNTLDPAEEQALAHVRDIKGFYQHAIWYGVSNVMLVAVNLIWYPEEFWALWCLLGWGFGLASHGLAVFEFFSLFSPQWEKAQVQKVLDRKGSNAQEPKSS